MNKYLLVRTDGNEIVTSLYYELKKAQKEMIRQFQSYHKFNFDELESSEYNEAELKAGSAKLIEYDSDIELSWRIIPVKVSTLDQFILIKTDGYTIEAKLAGNQRKAKTSMMIDVAKEKKAIAEEYKTSKDIYSEIKQESAVAGNGAMAYLWRIVKVEKGCFA